MLRPRLPWLILIPGGKGKKGEIFSNSCLFTVYCLRAMDFHTVIPLFVQVSCSGRYGRPVQTDFKIPSPVCLSPKALIILNKGLEVSIKGSVLFRNQENLRLLRTVRVERTQRAPSQLPHFTERETEVQKGERIWSRSHNLL